MKDEMKKDYESALAFWDSSFYESDEDKKSDLAEEIPEDSWKDLATSEKMLKAAESLSSYDKVLDYGCGYGWATILMAKSGCKNITAVDVVPNSIDLAAHYAKVYKTEGPITFKHIPFDWLQTCSEDSFDAALCSNVIDVVPTEVADSIIAGLARVVKKGGRVIIGMNYYTEPVADPARGITIKDGNSMFVNDVLRLVLHTDEEWSQRLSQYFEIEKLDHYAWPGEPVEKRRLFFLKVK